MRLVLVDTTTGISHDVREAEATIGRDPSSRITISGDAAKAVSGNHARVFLADGQWWVEDVGSRNGTFMGNNRLQTGVRHALAKGSIIGLGTTGPRLQVQELETRAIMQTMLESAPPPPPHALGNVDDLSRTIPLKRATSSAPPPPPPPSAPAFQPPPSAPAVQPPPSAPADGSSPRTTVIHVALHNNHTGRNYEADATTVNLGRAVECSVQIEGESAVSVSRIHAEIYLDGDRIVVRDNASRHGTFLNGKKLDAPQPISHGDFIMLGPGGPTFMVDDASIAQSVGATAVNVTPRVPGAMASPPKASSPKKAPVPENAGPVTRLARASGVVGRTLLFRNAIEEISQKSAKKLRVWTYATIVMVVVIVGGLVAYQRRQLAGEHTRNQAQVDSVRAASTAETNRLQHAFDSANKAAAPREVLDSLRNALDASGKRTEALETALQSTKQSLDQQLKVGDSVRKVAQAELVRARDEMTKANAAGTSSKAVLDSLQKALKAAEDRAKEVNDELRAAGSANWAQVASANERAVGVVVTYVGKDEFNGSGFAISPSGYFLTNRHVVTGDSSVAADSIFVIMTDETTPSRADLITVSPPDGPDVAVLRIRGFHSPYLQKIDWKSEHAVQGEAAALIGFPNGKYFAMDRTAAERPFITSGIFSRVTPDLIQFGGFSVHGSSGSPLFNRDGEVVAIHYAGLKEGPGMGFELPLSQVVPVLPATLKVELGIH